MIVHIFSKIFVFFNFKSLQITNYFQFLLQIWAEIEFLQIRENVKSLRCLGTHDVLCN